MVNVKNIQFNYLYRDGSNYKKFGNVIFSNITNIPLSDIESSIKSNLIDGEFFIASDWAVPELFFEVGIVDDHDWHEFQSLELTNTEPTHYLSIDDFLKHNSYINNSVLKP